jgi:hypothetical protein
MKLLHCTVMNGHDTHPYRVASARVFVLHRVERTLLRRGSLHRAALGYLHWLPLPADMSSLHLQPASTTCSESTVITARAGARYASIYLCKRYLHCALVFRCASLCPCARLVLYCFAIRVRTRPFAHLCDFDAKTVFMIKTIICHNISVQTHALSARLTHEPHQRDYHSSTNDAREPCDWRLHSTINSRTSSTSICSRFHADNSLVCCVLLVPVLAERVQWSSEQEKADTRL